MKVVFSELAIRELRDATRYYDKEIEGLGALFQSDVKKAARRIAAFPEAWPIERNDVRRCTLLRFPYRLLYSVEADHVFVIAVAHQHRRPDYWIERDEK